MILNQFHLIISPTSVLLIMTNFDVFTHASDHCSVVLPVAEGAASLARLRPSGAPGADGLKGERDS